MLLLLATLVLASEIPNDIPQTGRVKSCYDGDTFTLETGDKIRLRWVNTPERRPTEDLADEAKRAAEAFVLNRDVTLSLEPATIRDGYGRILAGLRTSRGDLSMHLVQQGLAHVFIIPPETADITPLIEAQRQARADKRGIWHTERYLGTWHITSFHANAPGDDRENVNGESLRVANITTEPQSLKGFTIENRSGKRFDLPDVVVPAGHTVKIFSGNGGHQGNPDYQLEVYLRSDQPVWNNEEDQATIRDPDGRVVDRVGYSRRE